MNWSRSNPSPRYHQLISQYQELHREGDPKRDHKPEDVYPGISLLPHIAAIRELVRASGATTILDYGSGKGLQYGPHHCTVGGEEWDNLMDCWDVDYVHCYDPCHLPFSKLPEKRFGGVVTTDVLEHCPEEDLDWIVAEIFGYAEKFVFASVSCRPAIRHLPNGENAHCTVRPPEWWRALFERHAGASPGVLLRVVAS